MFNIFKNKKRIKYQNSTTPDLWRTILRNEMPIYNSLSDDDKSELESILKVIYNEKEFIGAHGLKVTEEMKVLISAEASLLQLHRPKTYYPNLNTIIIYETTFISDIQEPLTSSIALTREQARIGESNHQTKTIVLAWDSARGQSINSRDGHNVILHEFAHQLDSETGEVNGAPLLQEKSSYRAWGEAMSQEFNHLQEDVKHHHKTFIDKYGATSGAEFFAVITESFFEKPITFKRKHPSLYKQLMLFYNQDPTEYIKQ